jgi:hypothetical protein
MDPVMGAHKKICKAFRKLATWNSDRHTKSIVKLLLQVLVTHWRERQGLPSVYQCRQSFQETKEASTDPKSVPTDDDHNQKSEPETMVKEGSPEESELSKQLESALKITDDHKDSSSPGPDDDSTVNGSEEEQRFQQPVENDFYDVLRLQSHFEDWDEEDNKDWTKQTQAVISLLEVADLTEIAYEPGGELKALTPQDLKRLISALESNAFGMFDRLRKKPVCFGRGKKNEDGTRYTVCLSKGRKRWKLTHHPTPF